MSIVAVRQALEIGLFTMTPAIDVAWENTSYTPVSGTPFVVAVLKPGTPENPTYGNNMYREKGVLMLQFNYPKNAGTATAAARAELTRQRFYRSASFTNSGITVTISGTPQIGDGFVSGDWWSLQMMIPWYANIQP